MNFTFALCIVVYHYYISKKWCPMLIVSSLYKMDTTSWTYIMSNLGKSCSTDQLLHCAEASVPVHHYVLTGYTVIGSLLYCCTVCSYWVSQKEAHIFSIDWVHKIFACFWPTRYLAFFIKTTYTYSIFIWISI